MSLLVSPVSMLVLEFVGSVCEANSSVIFRTGDPVDSMRDVVRCFV